MEIKITVKFQIGEIVYLVTDLDQRPFIVTSIIIESKCIKYTIGHSSNVEVICFDFEISRDVNHKLI